MKNIFLGYDEKDTQDGYFAQMHRQLAINGICIKHGFNYFHVPISGLTITPLDFFKTEKSAKEFLKKYNSELYSELNNEKMQFHKIVYIQSLSLKKLLVLKIMSYITFKPRLYKVANPHRVMERSPGTYKLATKILNVPKKNNKKFEIVLHFRSPINRKHIVPGEVKSRLLDEEYFIQILRGILKSTNKKKSTRITIVTDAPEKKIKVRILGSQLNKMNQYKYLMKNNCLEVEGNRFNLITAEFRDVRVLRGGNPIDAFKLMVGADILIMSRSSLSYIGAICNQSGEVFYPPGFWHKPLNNWIKAPNL
jgi:hypothetical protein